MKVEWDRVNPAQSSQEFLESHKPSSNAPTSDGWIWIRAGHSSSYKDLPGFLEKAQNYKEIWQTEHARIKDEEPVRSNKAKGLRSQKEWRDEVNTAFVEKLEKAAKKFGILSGKWLFFPTAEYSDKTWERIVNSFATGSLSTLPQCMTAKIMAVNESLAPVCVYVSDSFNKIEVEAVWKALAGIGLISTAFKADYMTLLDIDSKNSLGMRTSKYVAIDMVRDKDELESYKVAAAAIIAGPSISTPATSEQTVIVDNAEAAPKKRVVVDSKIRELDSTRPEELFLEDSDDEKPAKRQKK